MNHVACSSFLIPLACGMMIVLFASCDSGAPLDVNRGHPISARLFHCDRCTSTVEPEARIEVAIMLTGSDERPVSGWPVVWTPSTSSDLVDAPRGSVSADTTRTNAGGVAVVTWTLGDVPATYMLDARAAFALRADVATNQFVSPLDGPEFSLVVVE